MIMHGLVDEGVEVVSAVRARHDGARRNPWNDIECGSYYARSMSAWQLVNAWSGLHADFVAGTLSFAPASRGRPDACSGRPAPPSASCVDRGRQAAASRCCGGNRCRAAAPVTRQRNRRSDGGDRAQGRPQELPGAGGHPRHRPRHRRRLLHRLRRPLRLRQVHPAADDGRASRRSPPARSHIDGTRCDHLLPSARGMAMVFQSYALYPHMSVEQNLRFGLENQQLAKAGDRRARRQGRRHPADRATC